MKPTIVTIVGTRPEIIRLARLIPLLDETVNHIFVHTGQNTDPKLTDIFFSELKIRKPDYFLEVNTASLGSVLGDTLIKVEEIFIKHKPNGVAILGDTNSSIAAVLAKRMQIPVYHMEAGNRSFDENVPEETNRRMIDHAADFNLPYTEHARRNLLNEGLHPRRILLTGSPMKEILDHFKIDIEASSVLESLKLKKNEYFLVSAHRQENVDSEIRLMNLLESLTGIGETWGLPVVVSTHPRTRKQMQSLPGFKEIPNVLFHEPFGFFDYNKLQINAKCVISDSGSISEESSILGFPAITIRDSMERPEALDSGSIIMTGLRKDEVLAGINAVIFQRKSYENTMPPGYEVSDFSKRVVNFILSTVWRHHEWAGLREVARPTD
jgi:UDP-N-acetylglucosamine 2-epimerase (non-hydrolysing)